MEFETIYEIMGWPDGTRATVASLQCQNVYVDLDGTIHPHQFPIDGLWRFDGQIWYLPIREPK